MALVSHTTRIWEPSTVFFIGCANDPVHPLPSSSSRWLYALSRLSRDQCLTVVRRPNRENGVHPHLVDGKRDGFHVWCVHREQEEQANASGDDGADVFHEAESGGSLADTDETAHTAREEMDMEPEEEGSEDEDMETAEEGNGEESAEDDDDSEDGIPTVCQR